MEAAPAVLVDVAMDVDDDHETISKNLHTKSSQTGKYHGDDDWKAGMNILMQKLKKRIMKSPFSTINTSEF